MAEEKLETGSPFFIPMDVAFTGVANEPIRGLTNANNNIDVQVCYGLTDLKQAQVQFSLQGGRLPTLWSSEKVPVLSILGYSDGVQQPRDYWSKPFYLRHARRLEGQFLNVGGEGAGAVVFICDQGNDRVSTNIVADLKSLGEMAVVGIDSKFTNAANEMPTREYSAEATWDFLVQGFYSDLERATVKIVDADGLEWMVDWTPVWALAGRQSSSVPIRMLKRPYLIPAGRSIGVEFKNDAVPEASGKLWAFGQRLQRMN